MITLAVRKVAPHAAILTLWLTMLCPFDALYEGRLLSESLTAFFLCAGMAMALLSDRKWSWAAAGVCLGLSALARDTGLVLIPIAGAAALVFPVLRGGASRWAPLVLIAAGVMTVLPWTARNCTAELTCCAISKGRMGANLWVGTWSRDDSWLTATGRVWPRDAFDSDAERAAMEQLDSNDPANDAYYRNVAIRRIRTHPARVLARWLEREPRMWIGTRTDLFAFRGPPRGSLGWYFLKSGAFALNAALLALGLVGLGVAARKHRRLLWLAIPIVAITAVYFPFQNTETRYSQPVYPLVLAFGALGALAIRDSLRRPARRSAEARSAETAA